MSAFKAYDIRGVWGKDIDEELCYRAGFFLPGLLGARQVIVGRVNDSNEFSAPNHAFVNRITKRTVVYHSVESGSARSPQPMRQQGRGGETGCTRTIKSGVPSPAESRRWSCARKST